MNWILNWFISSFFAGILVLMLINEVNCFIDVVLERWECNFQNSFLGLSCHILRLVTLSVLLGTLMLLISNIFWWW